MIITIYELLGLMKDKNEPFKIKCFEKEYIFHNTIREYMNVNDEEDLLLCNIFIHRCLNEEVEILDKYFIAGNKPQKLKDSDD